MYPVNIDYNLISNVGSVYYRGTQLCDVQLADHDVTTIKEEIKKRDALLRPQGAQN